MKTITLNSHIGKDGILHLDIPVELTDTDLAVTVILQPMPTQTPQGKGWPPKFFEETAGCLKDTSFMIDSEGVFDDLEELQF